MSYLDDSLAQLKIFEDTVPWMYLDIKGLVTVGVGEMLDNAAKAQALAFVDSDGQAATPEAILADFNRVHALSPAHGPNFYRSSSSPVLPPPAIDALLLDHVESFEAELSARFPAYASFPDPAKLGLLDMIYNLGSNKLFNTFPHFMAAVGQQDWLGAAANCHRLGPNQARNDWTHDQFLAAAQATPPSGPEDASASAATS